MRVVAPRPARPQPHTTPRPTAGDKGATRETVLEKKVDVKIVESIIQEAMARGEFENLPGKGKPIDLTEYFNTPKDVRVAQSLLKNAGMVPVEIELLQEIAALKELKNSVYDDNEKDKIHKLLVEKQLQFNLFMERRKRQSK